ncbi:hypothetical protein HQ520_16940 [bacterium]|nr:hypothetical protein [bacterium]
MWSYLKSQRHSPAFVAACFLAGWLLFYLLLRAMQPALDNPTGGAWRSAENFLAIAAAADQPDIPLLEREYKIFNCPSISVQALGKLLEEDWGLELDSPGVAPSLKLEGPRYGGRYVAAILIDLLRPHGYGFFRQRDTIHLVEAQIREDRRERPGIGAIKTCRYQTRLRAAAGEPIDLWIESEPLIRLRITAQPLFGETTEKTPEVGILLEGRHNQRNWFHHSVETRLEQPVTMETKGRHPVWCLIKPTMVTEQEVILEVEFSYEASLPNA